MTGNANVHNTRALIKARGLCFSHLDNGESFPVFQDLDFEVETGSFVSFVGPSGCGKTTLLRLVSGLTAPTAGSLTIQEQPAVTQPLDFGFVFQSPSLFPWLTVSQNIAKPLSLAGFSIPDIENRVRNVLEMVQLQDADTLYPHQLSGGMRQRVSIARALAPDPEFLLMDEPFSAVDEISRENLNHMLYSLWRATGKTVMFVTHSIAEAVFLSSEIHVMSGRPATIVHTASSALPKKRDASTVESTLFGKSVTRIRKKLREAS